tara:strand:+ start:271 stop:561 length:291 start_codon:yes stop_codon:yes gene_type:complete
VNNSKNKKKLSLNFKKEFIVFGVFLFFTLLVLPIIIYVVGDLVFGKYEGNGYMDFLIKLIEKLLSVNYAAWILILSPYIGWQILRLSLSLCKSPRK